MKYVKVDSYGGCLHNTEMKANQQRNGRRSHGDKIIEKVREAPLIILSNDVIYGEESE